VSEIRILSVGLPRMLRDLLQVLLDGRPEIVFVGHVSKVERALAAVAATQANVVVFPVSDGEDADGVGRLLREPPRFKLLALSDAARRGVVYEIDPSSSLIEELTAETLLDAVGARALS